MNCIVALSSTRQDFECTELVEELILAPNDEFYGFLRLSNGQWFVKTSESVEEISSRLVGCCYKQDQIVIAEVGSVHAFPPEGFVAGMMKDLMTWVD